MPPFKLHVTCDDCRWMRRGWYPGVLIKADKHAGDRKHSLSVARPDGRAYCSIPSPKPDPENW